MQKAILYFMDCDRQLITIFLPVVFLNINVSLSLLLIWCPHVCMQENVCVCAHTIKAESGLKMQVVV